MNLPKVRGIVWNFWKEHGRHDLPWRKTTDPYKILVSEVMLQQTQVERVIPYYKNFLKQFPTVHALAQAPLGGVLKLWQGLGYNRRAKLLHEAAKAVAREHGGKFPKTAQELVLLPGIGPYTAGAVAAFAYNHDEIFIETNIRTVITHHIFLGAEQVSDAQVREVLEKMYPKGKAREWYAALMDYGAHLKRSGVRINARAKGYTKQSAFTGSAREARGAIVRRLSAGQASKQRLLKLLPTERREQLEEQLIKLLREGLVEKIGRSYRLPS